MSKIRVTVIAEYEPRLVDYPGDTVEQAAAFDQELLLQGEIDLDTLLDGNIKSITLEAMKEDLTDD